ncbi:hypothetical protein [Myxococcus xanthus]|uniref:hypothetical protein n=1 Tax=Myxococcus xanthus TaxID=34 RepID=UPI001F1F5293|nr:hypothetical protein [Myxococcus xanthus]
MALTLTGLACDPAANRVNRPGIPPPHTHPQPSTDWELVWQDDFHGAEGTPPSPERWVHDVGGHGWGNEQQEFNTDRTENTAHDGAGNLDGWTTLHVSLNSADPGFANVPIGMNDDQSVQLPASRYGYTNDGQWHHLAIPLADFVAGELQLNAVQAPFVFIAGAGPAADTLLLDNVYFTAD